MKTTLVVLSAAALMGLAGAITLACSAADGATPVCEDAVDPISGVTIDGGSCFTLPGDAHFVDDADIADGG